uniref:Response regulator MprA n=1 Tax=uncultured Actinomycetes bacterium TaxID=152507 RepID=A0A871Y792_9ACTN|nr:Response regulator MprA [uncultured Actinomycetes bacterium]
MTTAHILIVDDEAGVRDLLTDVLTISDYQTTSAVDGLEALNLLRSRRFDLVIADINMPRLDGFGLLEKMRAAGDETPVLMLTARDDRHDVTHGLRSGADDYLTKPFGLEELVLRVGAILKRTLPRTAPNGRSHEISLGDLWLSEDQHRVTYKGVDVELSPTEFRLLQYLMENSNKVVSKLTLLAEVWGMDFTTNTTIVDTYVSYLRKKMATVGFEGIVTVRGVGLQLVVK